MVAVVVVAAVVAAVVAVSVIIYNIMRKKPRWGVCAHRAGVC